MTLVAPETDTPLFQKPSRLFKPGSAPWLIRHHIRTRLRGKNASSKIQTWGRNIFLLLALGSGIFSTGTTVASALKELDGNYNYPPYLLKAGVMMLAYVVSLFGSSLISAYALFTDRDDLDLLLASPLPPERILTARMLQSAYGGLFTTIIMGTIAFGVSIVTVDARFLLIYPVLFSFTVLDLAISFFIARAILIWFGLRRGRTISMILGFGILILGVLIWVLNSSLNTPQGDKMLADMLGANFKANITAIVTPLGGLVFGKPLETLGLLCLSLSAFIGVGAFFWGRFASDAALMAGQAQHVAKTKTNGKVRFARGLTSVTILKEWRGMLRDPYVLVQVAVPLVSIIPLSFSLFMLQKTDSSAMEEIMMPIIGALVVLFGGQITGTLAWTAASIEEAGDLLLSSPSDGPRLFWSKAAATAIPSFLFIAIAMGLVALNSPAAAALGFLVGGFGLACCGAIEFLRPRPARRAKMTQRPDRAAFTVFLGFIFALIWAGATAMAMAGLGWWTLIPVTIGLLAMGFVWLTSPKSVVWMAKAPKVGAAGGPWKA